MILNNIIINKYLIIKNNGLSNIHVSGFYSRQISLIMWNNRQQLTTVKIIGTMAYCKRTLYNSI